MNSPLSASAHHPLGDAQKISCPNCGNNSCFGICEPEQSQVTEIHKFSTDRGAAYLFLNKTGPSFALHERCWDADGNVRLMTLMGAEHNITPFDRVARESALIIRCMDGNKACVFTAQTTQSPSIWYARDKKWIGVRGNRIMHNDPVVFGQNPLEDWRNGRRVNSLKNEESFVWYMTQAEGVEIHGFDRIFDYGTGQLLCVGPPPES